MTFSASPAAGALSPSVSGKPVEALSSKQASLLVEKDRRLEERLAALTDQVALLTETGTRLDRAATQQARRSFWPVDETRLIAAGFDPAMATALVKQPNQSGVKELYLRNQAMREGWLGTEKYKDPRAELNESDHDRLLYATSKPNGAAVESVIGESAAVREGLQAGGCRSGQFCDRGQLRS